MDAAMDPREKLSENWHSGAPLQKEPLPELTQADMNEIDRLLDRERPDYPPVHLVMQAQEKANQRLRELLDEENKERRSVSSTGGEKGVKLERFDLVPVGPLTELARRYGVGAEKYAERNWERGYEWSKSYAALQRHLNAFWNGEDEDPETPGGHLSAAAFHIFALMEFMNTHPEFDDRPNTP